MQIADKFPVFALPNAERTLHTPRFVRLALAWRRALAHLTATAVLASVLVTPHAASTLPLALAAPSVSTALLTAKPPIGVLFGQVDPRTPIKAFLEFLSWVLILLGVCLVAYGAILIAQGRHLDGVVAIVAGFILVLAVPIIYYFAKLAGIQF